MQLHLLAVGLGLVSVLSALEPPLLVAQPEQLVGEWHIIRWMGTPIIPNFAMVSSIPPQVIYPLPPFTMELSDNNILVKVKLRQHSGNCEVIKIPLRKTGDPTKFIGEKQQEVHIWATKMKSYFVMHSEKQMRDTPMQMFMLIGHTTYANPEALRMFEEIVERKGQSKAEIVAPPHNVATNFCMTDNH